MRVRLSTLRSCRYAERDKGHTLLVLTDNAPVLAMFDDVMTSEAHSRRYAPGLTLRINLAL